MIHYDKFELSNGLRVIVHADASTPLACVNILYDVGARDEDEERTGFAHLFEHLMFGGSVNIPSYDEPLQMVGGENNAFTTNDITNYYLTLPAENLETAMWLESDRMLSLAFSEKSLEVQPTSWPSLIFILKKQEQKKWQGAASWPSFGQGTRNSHINRLTLC